MFRAEQLVAEIRSKYLTRVFTRWRGYERQFVIELVRGLDEAAFAFTMAPNRAQLLDEDIARHHMCLGAASALRPFLEVLRDDPGGVPWGSTSLKLGAVADQHLINCGQFAVVQRLAALERYGLAQATFRTEDHLVLEVTSGEEDAAERAAGAWLGSRAREKFFAAEARMVAMKSQVAARIDRYADVSNGWFLKYDPDWDMIQYHRDYATVSAAGIAEGDALPTAALLGGRTFADWNEASITALGRLLHHVACATRLKAMKRGLQLRNLLTLFARKDDIAAVWGETGETSEWAERIMGGLMLDTETAVAAERDHEMPLPYYIDFGRHFVLLPVFGGLMNPYAGLVSHLRRTYRQDWDRSVDGRERVFRDELRQMFPPPRYVVPVRGIRLRRDDGSELTDVDAVILDTQTGRLMLVQLKWPDIYGRSLAERNSRRINLLKANEWVGRVSEWVGDRSSGEVATALNVGMAGDQPPAILVIARHVARFSGETAYDARAQWISWPTLAQIRTQSPESDVLELLAAKPARVERDRHSAARAVPVVYHLPGLVVEIRPS